MIILQHSCTAVEKLRNDVVKGSIDGPAFFVDWNVRALVEFEGQAGNYSATPGWVLGGAVTANILQSSIFTHTGAVACGVHGIEVPLPQLPRLLHPSKHTTCPGGVVRALGWAGAGAENTGGLLVGSKGGRTGCWLGQEGAGMGRRGCWQGCWRRKSKVKQGCPILSVSQ
eukprot:453706-Rhodomonas_salina.1